MNYGLAISGYGPFRPKDKLALYVAALIVVLVVVFGQ